MTSEWRGITTSVLSNVMTAGPSHLCHPLLDLNMCKRFNAGTKPIKPSLKLRGLVGDYNKYMGGVDLLDSFTAKYKFPIKSRRWYMYIFWHTIILAVVNAWLLYKRDCKALKVSSKETMNRRQFQAQLASSLILVNATLQTPKRGRPSSGKGCLATQTVTSGSPLNAQKRPSKRCAHLPLDVRKDLVAHFPRKTGRGRCRQCNKGYTNTQCRKCDVRLCFLDNRDCFWDFHHQ